MNVRPAVQLLIRFQQKVSTDQVFKAHSRVIRLQQWFRVLSSRITFASSPIILLFQRANRKFKRTVLPAAIEVTTPWQIRLTHRCPPFRAVRFLMEQANTRFCVRFKDVQPSRGHFSGTIVTIGLLWTVERIVFGLAGRQFSFSRSENCWKLFFRLRCCPEEFVRESS